MRRGWLSTGSSRVGSCRMGSGCSRGQGGEGDRSRSTWARVQVGGGACGGRAGALREAGRVFDLLPLLLARRSVRLPEDLALSGSLVYGSGAGGLWRGLAAGGTGTIRLAYLPQVAVVPPSLTQSRQRKRSWCPHVWLGVTEFPGTQTQFLSILMQRLLGEQSLFSDSGLWLRRVSMWGF